MKVVSKHSTRLSGASLVEALIALSLISIVFVIASMAILELNGGQSPARKLDQRMISRQLLQEAEAGRNLSDEVREIAGYKFLREVLPLDASGLYEVKITCYDAGNNELLKRGKIIWKHAN